ncbi:uncharacterized protein [Antedon mediterranea]|uniref:uncharacterized protein n=1 Tax=Antedon mediterranea TaxID=105859 RepID=UPI003AF60FAE
MADFVIYIFPAIGIMALVISCCCSYASKGSSDIGSELSDNDSELENGFTDFHFPPRIASPDPSTFIVPPSYEIAMTLRQDSEQSKLTTPLSPPPTYEMVVFDRLMVGLPMLTPEDLGVVTFPVT